MEDIRELLGEPSAIDAPRSLEWVERSRVMAVG